LRCHLYVKPEKLRTAKFEISNENYLLSRFLPQTPEGAFGLHLFEKVVDARSPL
jgi:hypothetical protein